MLRALCCGFRIDEFDREHRFGYNSVSETDTTLSRQGCMRERLIGSLGLLVLVSGVAGCTDGDEPTEERQVGFEIIEIQSPSSIRAWICPDITFEEFEALELSMGWRKNQPRESAECGADVVRFIKSPDSVMDGDYLVEEHFGFMWFHAASITDPNVPLDDEGLLTGIRVRKFHELTYNVGSCLVLLVSPDDDVYFRIGRDANRTSDDPSIPDSWRLETYITPEELVFELFDENLVIRTDNQDSFQGPIPQLAGAV